jgi:hypothetical protein
VRSSVDVRQNRNPNWTRPPDRPTGGVTAK